MFGVMTIDVEGDHVEADHVEGNDVEGDNVEETDNDGHGRCEMLQVNRKWSCDEDGVHISAQWLPIPRFL